jgi:hypothetical protein
VLTLYVDIDEADIGRHREVRARRVRLLRGERRGSSMASPRDAACRTAACERRAQRRPGRHPAQVAVSNRDGAYGLWERAGDLWAE